MKKLSALVLVFTSAFSTVLFGQGGNPGHLRSPIEFLGWNGTGPTGALQVRNDFASQPITFFTGGSAPANQRMIINGSTGPTAGFVGIGPNFSAPQNLLHVKSLQPFHSYPQLSSELLPLTNSSLAFLKYYPILAI